MITLNVAVDPYGVYRHGNRDARSRITLAEKLRSQSFDTLLLGTSSSSAFEEDSPHLHGRRTLNAALAGATITEFETVVHHAVQNARVKRVVMLLDFAQFNMRSAEASDFDRSLFNSDLNGLEYHADKLLGVTTTQASISRLLRKWKVLRSTDENSSTSPDVMPRSRFEADARHSLKSPAMLHGFRYSIEELERFRETVRFVQSRGVDLHIAMNPIHVTQLEAIRAAGLWETFEGWKRDIAGILTEENINSAKTSPLWDFTSYASYPAEPMPAADSAEPPVYYHQGSHFTPALAEIVLERMFHWEPRHEQFGVRLHKFNVEQQDARIREQYESWRERNVTEIAWMQEIAKECGHKPAAEVVASREDWKLHK